ncbi:MAG: phosphatase PAP2 family protein [Proteobacteria bacterium]|nr:phosphatase PAP2 family protein [Pseudomonadota bacterium]
MKAFSLKFHLLCYSLLLIAGTLLFRTTDLDFWFSDLWYFSEDSWVGIDHPFWGPVYKYLTGPNIITLYLGLVTLVYAHYIARNNKLKWSATCVVIAIIIGPGILVNGTLKPLMGRPRPYVIERYQGEEKFVPVLQKSNVAKSFPSGHAASGFVLTILFYVFYQDRRKLAWLFWFGGIGLGTLLSIGRIAQGGHFASDNFWAFGLTQITNCVVYFKLQPLINRPPGPETQSLKKSTLKNKAVFTTLSLSVTALFLVGYLINFPFTFHKTSYSSIPNHINQIDINANLEDERIVLFERQDRVIGIDHLAFANGFPWSDVSAHTSVETEGNTLTYSIRIDETGFFRDYKGRIKIFLPKNLPVSFSKMRGSISEDLRGQKK